MPTTLQLAPPEFSDLPTALVLKARGWNEPIVRPSDPLHQSPLSN